MVGVDEVSYRRRHRYLTVVADHDTGRVVWVAKGRNSATLQELFAELGEPRATIRAVSIDMSGGYEKAIREAVPDAEIAFDPFHVVRVGADAVDQVRRDEWNATTARTAPRAAGSRTRAGRCSKPPTARALISLARSARSTPPTSACTAPSCCITSCGCSTRSRLLYALEDRALASAHLDAWLRWASRSRLAPFVVAARTLRRHRTGILAAVRLDLSNGRIEGLNSRVRLISHRSFGFHSAAPLIALVYLCCAGITIDLPMR